VLTDLDRLARIAQHDESGLHDEADARP